jgi:hypothetical protein
MRRALATLDAGALTLSGGAGSFTLRSDAFVLSGGAPSRRTTR